MKPLNIALVFAGMGVAIAASWALVDTVIHMTSDDAFCGSCHSHAPISASYREDIHGGANASGWRATCSQCHIPQGNALRYLWVKGMHGLVDPTMELIKAPEDIDWHGNRERREEYVYDSGCLSCHAYLEQAGDGNRKSFRPHRRYFNDSGHLSCVACHEHVGHRRLGYHLEEMGWLRPEGGQQ